jgi:hypothetical protein
MKPGAERLDVTTEELEALLESVREPLGEVGYQKLKAAIRTLGYVTELLENREATLAVLRRLLCRVSTEKTAQVLKQAGVEVGDKKRKPAGSGAPETVAPGHGRHEAAAYRGAHHVKVPHGSLHQGDRCPECQRGKVYPLRDPGLLVRAAKSTRCAIPVCWCGSKGGPRSRPRYTSWKSCAAYVSKDIGIAMYPS